MSVLGVKPGHMGESIMLSRFEKGSAPITVHIPTSNRPVRRRLPTSLPPGTSGSLNLSLLLQRPVSWMVQEMDEILVQQKVVSCVSEKAKWWEGRRELDSQVEVSVQEALV